MIKKPPTAFKQTNSTQIVAFPVSARCLDAVFCPTAHKTFTPAAAAGMKVKLRSNFIILGRKSTK